MKDNHTVGGKCGNLTFLAKNSRNVKVRFVYFFEVDGFSAIVPPSENSKNKKCKRKEGRYITFLELRTVIQVYIVASMHYKVSAEGVLYSYKYHWHMQLMNCQVEDEGWAAEWSTEKS